MLIFSTSQLLSKNSFLSVFGVHLLLEVIFQAREIHSRRGVKQTFCEKQMHHRVVETAISCKGCFETL